PLLDSVMKLTTQLPRSPTSASLARQLVNAHTTTLGSQQREDAALLVSELVSNALLHGLGEISLRIDVEPDGLYIEVSDQGNASPAPTSTAHPHRGGWGLRIVDNLANDWGVLEGSTRVWFRLTQPRRED
ncbi:MAG TPA: ATP-binding protein, partial [Solirubrobacteraceae bacterium]